MEEQLLDITKNVCTIQMDLPIYHWFQHPAGSRIGSTTHSNTGKSGD